MMGAKLPSSAYRNMNRLPPHALPQSFGQEEGCPLHSRYVLHTESRLADKMGRLEVGGAVFPSPLLLSEWFVGMRKGGEWYRFSPHLPFSLPQAVSFLCHLAYRTQSILALPPADAGLR